MLYFRHNSKDRRDHMFRHFAVAIALLVPVAAFGQFTTIADTTTAIPNGSGNFISYPPDPCISGGDVAFVGNGSNSQTGIYLSQPAAALAALANTNTKIPAGNGSFVSYPNDPCL